MDKTVEEKLESIFPEVIGVVITSDREKTNLCPINFQAVSTKYENPTTICLGLSNGGYTLKNILKSNQFVYAYPTQDQLEDVIYCGTVSGKLKDKLKNTNLKFDASTKVAPPNLSGAVINFECTLKHYYNAGDFTIVIGEVLEMNGDNRTASKKIYSLGGTRYGTLDGFDVLKEGR